jgi:23S rRNA (uracil1939-C5)-methyltransferase
VNPESAAHRCEQPDAEPSADAGSAPRKLRRGDLLEVEVEGYAAGGGVRALYADASGSYRIELKRGVPGERVRVEVASRRGRDVRARMGEVLRASPHAVEPRCAHFPTCGGCSHQDLAYQRQLEEKRRTAERILAGHGLLRGPDAPAVEPCIACDPPWRYRNRMDFTFGALRWIEAGEPEEAERGFALGLHPAGQYEKVLDVRSCSIVFEEAEAILSDARSLAREQGLEAWDLDRKAGLLRHLVLRKSFARGEILANLVTSEEAPGRVRPFVDALLARQPCITTFVQTIYSGLAKITLGERELTLHGPGRIVEELCGLEFRIGARTFFQTNTRQAERLTQVVLAAAQVRPGDTVYDLYCGAGALTLPLARAGARTLGIEIVPEALADARENGRRNGIEGLELLCGDVAALLAGPELPQPDVIVADPPRGGLHPTVVDALRRSPARRLVYVSCRIESAARDLAALAHGGWRLARAQPIDLFPHTPHLETVLALERAR